MQATICPICFSPLESREVAPCIDCGHDPIELQNLKDRRHTYAEFRISDDLSLVLRNSSQADFSSYDAAYFGLPPKTPLGLGHMSLLRHIDPSEYTFDKICPECQRRLAFLEFVLAARAFHETHRHI
jgi:hypothetical protein